MKLLLIDDHAMVREGLALALNARDSALFVDQAESCEAALERRGTSYALILLDLTLPGARDLDAIALVRGGFPETPVVVVSGQETPEMVYAAIDAGAMGFVPKSASSQMLIGAVTTVLSGGIVLPSPVRAARLHNRGAGAPQSGSRSPAELLAPRQVEVLGWLLQAKSNKFIARQMNVEVRTVRNHLEKIYETLGVHSRTEVVCLAAKLGWRLDACAIAPPAVPAVARAPAPGA